jgi:proteasome lid subunit RPN8/RPN11
MIERIVVHKSLVDSFKRKAAKAMPHEIIVAVLGKMANDELHIYAFDHIEVDSSVVGARRMMLQYGQPEEEMEAGTNLKYYGTLHSHPNSTTKPSDIDKKDFMEKFNAEEISQEGEVFEYLHDEIMGIMSLNKKTKVIQYGLVFYNIDFEPIEIIIAEDKKNQPKEARTHTKVIAKKATKRKKRS